MNPQDQQVDPAEQGKKQIMKTATEQLVHEMLVFLSTQEMSDSIKSVITNPVKAHRSQYGTFKMAYEGKFKNRIEALTQYFKEGATSQEQDYISDDVFKTINESQEDPEQYRERMKRLIYWLSVKANAL